MCVFEKGSTLVMIGDSVTDVGRVRRVAESMKEKLGKGYVALVDAMLTACRPDLQMRIINMGISGNTSSHQEAAARNLLHIRNTPLD